MVKVQKRGNVLIECDLDMLCSARFGVDPEPPRCSIFIFIEYHFVESSKMGLFVGTLVGASVPMTGSLVGDVVGSIVGDRVSPGMVVGIAVGTVVGVALRSESGSVVGS